MHTQDTASDQMRRISIVCVGRRVGGMLCSSPDKIHSSMGAIDRATWKPSNHGGIGGEDKSTKGPSSSKPPDFSARAPESLHGSFLVL
jgi:hypothetical protein